jgi:hypothetical protein
LFNASEPEEAVCTRLLPKLPVGAPPANTTTAQPSTRSEREGVLQLTPSCGAQPPGWPPRQCG